MALRFQTASRKTPVLLANVGAAGIVTDFLKMLDFGLAKFFQEENEVAATAPGRAIGTPASMAPEIALGRPSVNHQADICSLGCVAYWLLTGYQVFEAETPMKMLVAHVEPRPTVEMPFSTALTGD